MKIILFISILINIIFLYLLQIALYTGRVNHCSNKFIYQQILYDNLKSDIKSGDLLLFSNLNYSFLTRTFGHFAFSHIGIVVKYNNILYSLEMVYNDDIFPGDAKITGIIFIPLKERVLNYSGYVYISSLLKPLDQQQETKLYNFSKKNYKFLNIKDLYRGLSNFKQDSNTKICSQFIVNILEELNILEKKNMYKFWNYHKQIIDLCNDITYSHPVQIISNELLINNISDRKLINYC